MDQEARAPTAVLLSRGPKNENVIQGKNNRMRLQIVCDLQYDLYQLLCVLIVAMPAVYEYCHGENGHTANLWINTFRDYNSGTYFFLFAILVFSRNAHILQLFMLMDHPELMDDKTQGTKNCPHRDLLFGTARIGSSFCLLAIADYDADEDFAVAISIPVIFAILRVITAYYDYIWYHKCTSTMKLSACLRGSMGIPLVIGVFAKIKWQDTSIFISCSLCLIVLWMLAKIVFFFEVCQDKSHGLLYLAMTFFAFVGHSLNAIWLVHNVDSSWGILVLGIVICYALSIALELKSIKSFSKSPTKYVSN